MKRYFLLILMLSACQSINYQDVNPMISPNANKLPAMEPMVDMYNLEAVYTGGGYTGTADNYGIGYVNDRWGNWVQTTSASGTQYKDARVNDVINIFNKEVKENITDPYGEKKGYISLKLGYRGKDGSIFYPLVSALSLWSVNLLGFPAKEAKQSLEVEVEIWNKKKEIVRRYTANALNVEYIAMYWGYDEAEVYRKVAADNIKQALEQIRKQINNDAEEIKLKLK